MEPMCFPSKGAYTGGYLSKILGRFGKDEDDIAFL